MDEGRETHDVFQKFSVLSVRYLGKCLWLLMNCRKEKELEYLNFRFFFPVVWTRRMCKSLHSPKLNVNCLDQGRWGFVSCDEGN